MTATLFKKLIMLLDKMKESNLSNNPKVSEEYLKLERLALEVQDYWDGHRNSRYFRNGIEQLTS